MNRPRRVEKLVDAGVARIARLDHVVHESAALVSAPYLQPEHERAQAAKQESEGGGKPDGKKQRDRADKQPAKQFRQKQAEIVGQIERRALDLVDEFAIR